MAHSVQAYNPVCLQRLFIKGEAHAAPLAATEDDFRKLLTKKGLQEEQVDQFLHVLNHEPLTHSGVAREILSHVLPEQLKNPETANSIAYTLRHMASSPDALKLDFEKTAKMLNEWEPLQIAGMGRFYEVANDAEKGVTGTAKREAAVKKALEHDGMSAEEAKGLMQCGHM